MRSRSEVALPWEQRRGRSVAMGKAELDAFLTEQRTRRVATAGVYGELRGAELLGAVDIVGEAPRTGTPDARLTEPERPYARKYNGSGVMHHTGHHAWLWLVPDKITSWDFRKKAAFEGDAFDFG